MVFLGLILIWLGILMLWGSVEMFHTGLVSEPIEYYVYGTAFLVGLAGIILGVYIC